MMTENSESMNIEEVRSKITDQSFHSDDIVTQREELEKLRQNDNFVKKATEDHISESVNNMLEDS
jgi:hypothetical protein